MTQAELLSQWQAQDATASQASLDYFRHRVGELARDTKRQTLGVNVVRGMWLFLIVRAMLLGKFLLGGWMLAYGVMGYVYGRKRRVRAINVPKFQGGLDALTFYRQEVERKRDWCRSRGSWPAITQFVIAMLSFLIVVRIEYPSLPIAILTIGFGVSMVALLAVLIENRREFTKLQREIDALATLSN